MSVRRHGAQSLPFPLLVARYLGVVSGPPRVAPEQRRLEQVCCVEARKCARALALGLLGPRLVACSASCSRQCSPLPARLPCCLARPSGCCRCDARLVGQSSLTERGPCKFGMQAVVSQHRATSGRNHPALVESGLTLAEESGRRRSKSGQIGRNWADCAKCQPTFAKSEAISTALRPNSAKRDQMWARFDQIWAEFGRCGFRTEVGLESTELGPIYAA